MENFENNEVKKTSSELYYDYVTYLNDHSFTNNMLRYMLREFISLTSLISYDEHFNEIMSRFLISCKDVEPQLNSL